jgi:hypothetical protein
MAATGLDAQFKTNIYFGGGLSTISMPGENPNTLPMVQRDTTKDQITGGSLNGSQPGFEFRFTFTLDEEENMRIPIGMDYTFYRAAERIPISAFSEARLKHSVDAIGVNLGFHYAFLEFPNALAKVYAGIEARGTYIYDGKFRKILDYKLDDRMDEDITVATKENTTRFGGLLRLGIEGELLDPWYINTSFGFSLLNLIGRDNERGELFTLFSNLENEESLVKALHFSFLIQYKL